MSCQCQLPVVSGEGAETERRLQTSKKMPGGWSALGVVWFFGLFFIVFNCKSSDTATPAEGLREVKTGVLKTENPALEVPLNELFA